MSCRRSTFLPPPFEHSPARSVLPRQDPVGVFPGPLGPPAAVFAQKMSGADGGQSEKRRQLPPLFTFHPFNPSLSAISRIVSPSSCRCSAGPSPWKEPIALTDHSGPFGMPPSAHLSVPPDAPPFIGSFRYFTRSRSLFQDYSQELTCELRNSFRAPA